MKRGAGGPERTDAKPKGSELKCRFHVGSKHMSFDRLEKFDSDSIWGFEKICKIADEIKDPED